MHIQQVETTGDLRRFIRFPYRLYRDDPIWVPPLRTEQWGQFNPARNPMLDHCDYDLFLLIDDGRVIGRVSAFVDSLAVKHWGAPIGLFGSYECVDDPQASRLLLGMARDRLHERGMARMRGPWSFASQEWGLVIEGYQPPPVIMAPYNPPYYNRQLADFGFKKAKDLVVYYADVSEGYRVPDRYLTLTDRVQERYGISMRSLDKSRFEEEILTLVSVINRSIADNWGFYPVTRAEALAIAHDLKPIVHVDAVLIAEGPDGAVIGFSVPLPDVNVLLRGLNGRLLPFGWLKLLWGLPRLRAYRLWALGVVPEYHGKGIDALLYRRTHEVLSPRRARVEVNYVLEDNLPMNNALRKLGVKNLRRYRVYEMPLH
jgi:ribosomal protein S18 acetylase RimI-like enzyme